MLWPLESSQVSCESLHDASETTSALTSSSSWSCVVEFPSPLRHQPLHGNLPTGLSQWWSFSGKNQDSLERTGDMFSLSVGGDDMVRLRRETGRRRARGPLGARLLAPPRALPLIVREGDPEGSCGSHMTLILLWRARK